MTISYATIEDDLIRALPEFRSEHQRFLDSYGGESPGAYVAFGTLLMPALSFALKRGDVTRLERILSFVELLASSDDEAIRTLAAVEILYPLASIRGQQALHGRHRSMSNTRAARYRPGRSSSCRVLAAPPGQSGPAVMST